MSASGVISCRDAVVPWCPLFPRKRPRLPPTGAEAKGQKLPRNLTRSQHSDQASNHAKERLIAGRHRFEALQASALPKCNVIGVCAAL